MGGLHINSMVSVGGGAKNELWNEIKANVLNLPVSVASEPEASIKGCALLAAKGIGLIADMEAEALKRRRVNHIVDPIEEDVSIYQKRL